jgi:hypothetical protein
MQNDKLHKWIGTICALFVAIGTLLLVLFTVVSKTRESPRLKVLCYAGSFYIPLDYKNEVSNFLEDSLLQYFSQHYKRSSPIPVIYSSEIKDKFPGEVLTLWDLRSYWKFTVRNTGNKEAMELQLELPFSGIYLINKIGSQEPAKRFDKIIKDIGNIRPANEISIEIWTTDDYDDYYKDYYKKRIKLTDSGGLIPISYTYNLQPGFWNWWWGAKFPYVIYLLLFFYLLYFLPDIFELYNKTKRRKKH